MIDLTLKTAKRVLETFGPCSEIQECWNAGQILEAFHGMTQGKEFVCGHPWMDLDPVPLEKAVQTFCTKELWGQKLRDDVGYDKEAFWQGERLSAEAFEDWKANTEAELKEFHQEMEQRLEEQGLLLPKAERGIYS